MQMTSSANIDENLDYIERALEAADPLDLLVLPENFAEIPIRQELQHTEGDGVGRVQNFLITLSQRFDLVIVAGSLPIISGSNTKPFARCLIVTPSGVASHYDKLHLFDVDVTAPQANGQKTQRYRESDSYELGELNTAQLLPRTLEIGLNTVRLGPSICYDLRFPELYRKFSESGVDLITVPSAFTYRTGQAHWECLLRARAIENQAFVLASAQVGIHANGRQTWGHSMIIDPWGHVLAQEPVNQGLLYANLDLNQIEQLSGHFPVNTQRRLD